MAKKPEVNDPLEQAKIPAPSAAPQAVKEAAKASSPSQAPGPVEEPELPPPEAPKKRLRFRVLNRVTLSWGSQFIRLSPGDIVDDVSYGPGAIEKMREGGVALEAAE